MFEFSLENGKKQLKQGLILLIPDFLLGTILAILLSFVKSEVAVIVLSSILGLATACLTILCMIKIIFGAVVYHAERTSTRSA